MSGFKRCATGLVAIAFASSSLAGPLGPDGLDTEPKCKDRENIVSTLKETQNQVPTGITGRSPHYQLEIYANLQRGDYTVVGKKVDDSSKKDTCRVKVGFNFPEDIQNEPYYKLYFANVSSNQALIKKYMGAMPVAQAGITTVALKPQ